MELKFEIQLKIQRPTGEVFDAVYNPDKLRRYFVSGGASGPLRQGTTVYWTFADGPENTYPPFPVTVQEVVPDRRIVFDWGAADGDYPTRVEMRFEPLGVSETRVSIAESGWKETPEGLRSAFANCRGWSEMVECLKAFVQYGINLRAGSY